MGPYFNHRNDGTRSETELSHHRGSSEQQELDRSGTQNQHQQDDDGDGGSASHTGSLFLWISTAMVAPPARASA